MNKAVVGEPPQSVSADAPIREGSLGDYQVYARCLLGLREYLTSEGACYEAIAAQAGLEGGNSERLDSYVSLCRFAHFLELAAEATGDELFALRWVSKTESAAFGPLGQCVSYAPTVRVGLEVLARYVTVQVDVETCDLAEKDGVTTLSWTYTPLVLRQDQLIDRGAALRIGKMRSMAPDNEAPFRIELARSRPRSQKLHHRLLGQNVIFECERNALSYRSDLLDLPNSNSDPILFMALCELNARLCDERCRQNDLTIRVKEEILRRLTEDTAALEPIARALGFSSRGLQRRLAEHKTTFNNILELTRREAAIRYIEETDFLISEIAYRLGFSTIGNFTRAAKRWFGCTPREYRQGLQSMTKHG